MGLNIRRFTSGIQLLPRSDGATAPTIQGELAVSSVDGHIYYYNGTGIVILDDTSSSNTLTNKTIAVGANHIIGTVNRAAQFNSSTGDLEASAVTNTELGYVSGVTSSIQAQLNAISGAAITALTGDVSATGPGSVPATVVMVGGASAASIAAAALAVSLATPNDNPNTLVLRDGSGNFAASTITVAGIASTSAADITISTLNNHNIELSPNGSGLIVANKPVEIVQNLRLDRADDSTTTGSAATLAAFTASFVKVTNASLASLSGIPAGANGQILLLTNGTGTTITVNNEDGSVTASNRILTGTGNLLTLSNNASIELVYDTGASRWRIVGGSGGGSNSVFGSRGTPRSIVAGTGITVADGDMSATASNQLIFVQGSGGPVVITASPAIQAGVIVGQVMTIIGRSNTNTLEIDNQPGLVELNGNVVLGLSDAISLIFDGTAWVETSRS